MPSAQQSVMDSALHSDALLLIMSDHVIDSRAVHASSVAVQMVVMAIAVCVAVETNAIAQDVAICKDTVSVNEPGLRKARRSFPLGNGRLRFLFFLFRSPKRASMAPVMQS